VREIAPYVLRHRLIVDPRVDADDVLREALALEVVPASDPEPVSALS
jgi:hypothetical protein